MDEELMRFIVSRLLESAKQAHWEAKNTPDDEYCKGKKIAYYCVMDTIKSELCANGLDPKNFELDINLEEALL